MAVLPHFAIEHGHGAGQELDRDRLALCRTSAGYGLARKYLRAHPARMAHIDRDAVGHHGAGALVTGQPAAGALDPQPLSLSRSAEPCAGGIAEGASRAESRRTGAARYPAYHQRHFGGVEE